MKIVVTGKTGLLSTIIADISPSVIGLSKEEYDISDSSIINKLNTINPDIIIHAGAVTNSNEVTSNPIQAINVNVIGTANMAKYCIDFGKRLVYISTDYVYDSKRSNHKETDALLPYNEYAWTKLGGECSVRQVKNHVIIRTSFGSSKFPYDVAWDNLITNKDYVDVIAPKILDVATSDFIGIINIGTTPKSIYEYAVQRNVVNKASLPTTVNFSLDTNLYEQTFSN